MCVCSLSYPPCKTHGPYFILICGLSGSTIFFLVVIINGTIFWKPTLNEKCVFWICLQFMCEAFLIMRKIHRDTVINVNRSLCIFSTDFRKIIEYQIFMKIRPVGSELFHEDGRKDGQTDMTKLIVVFPRICLQILGSCDRASWAKCAEREKTNKMQQLDVYYQLLSQHVSGIMMTETCWDRSW